MGRSSNGRVLADLSPDDATDDLLTDLWRQVGALHDALIAHGALNTRNVVIVDGRPVITDFTKATTGANERRRAADLAELLTSTALLVGDDRAIAALSAGLGADALGDVIPMLQAPALSRTTQSMLGRHREAGKRLDALRTAAAKAAGVDVPELVELHRVSPTNLMMAIGTLVAAAVLLGQVGSPQEIWDTVKNAEWWLVGLALVLSLATNIPYADRAHGLCAGAVSRCGRPARPSWRCRSGTSRSRRSVGSRSRSVTCKNAASTSRLRSARAGCSAPSATSYARSCSSSSRSSSRRRPSTSDRSTPRRPSKSYSSRSS